MTGKLRILCISTMFPNPRMPVHAQFVKQRLDAVSRLADIMVVSPIPWFPGESFIPHYANRHAVPARAEDTAYPVHFPKFFSFPVVLKPVDGFALAWCVYRFIRKHGLQGKIDLLDCHLAFPEGFAGALLSKWLGLPYVVTLRGHDINDLHRFPVRVRQVVYALKHSVRYFGVAQALVDGAVRLGAPADKGYPSTNGVDNSRFFPIARSEARTKLGLRAEARIMLSVSHLNPRKGVDILIGALSLLASRGLHDLHFVIVGKGGEEGNVEPELRALAEKLGVSDRITWAGAVLNTDLRLYYSAADVFCLASEKEGWPNVILESLACATPVVATAVWGIPEVLCSESLGLLVHQRTPEAFSARIAEALEKTWNPGELTGYAARNSWDSVAQGLLGHFEAVVGPGVGNPVEGNRGGPTGRAGTSRRD